MIQPVPAPTDPGEISGLNRKISSAQDPLTEGDPEFEKVMENIILDMAKDFWSQQDIKK